MLDPRLRLHEGGCVQILRAPRASCANVRPLEDLPNSASAIGSLAPRSDQAVLAAANQ